MSAAVIDLAQARARKNAQAVERGAAEDIAEAIERVDDLTARRELQRRNPRGARLSAPGCEEGCKVCHRECAVTGIMLRWWSGELASLTGAGGRVH